MPKGSLPHRRELFGAVLFLDVNGFTAITEAAARKGRYGVEMVTEVINRHFEIINRMIRPLGGEIYKFGGDSCLVVFAEPEEAALEQIRLLPAQISEHARKLDKFFWKKHHIHFALHGSLSFGKINISLVGDPSCHLDYFLDGEAIKRAYQLADGARSVVCDPAVYTHLNPAIFSTRKPAHYQGKLFLAPNVRKKLAEGEVKAELRNAAVIFIHLEPECSEEFALEQYDELLRKIQNIVYRYEGLINKIDYTEKGYLMLCVFGIPYLHADDVERAFIAATRITQINQGGISLKLGINYSNIFVGRIGAVGRWEYGIIGNAVNIAARLMSHAGSGEICISDEIVERISARFETSFLQETLVKGIKKPIGIYRLVRELPQQWNHYQKMHKDRPVCLDGADLREALDSLDSGSESLIRIQGRQGSGKSYACWLICNHLDKLGRPYEIVNTDSYTQSLRLEVFYRSVRTALGLVNLREQFAELCAFLAEHGIAHDPAILRRQLFETAAKASAEEQELTQNCIFDLLAVLYPPSKALIVDPFDLFDPQSRELLQKLARRNLAEGGIVVFSMSNPDAWNPGEYFHQCNVNLIALNSAQCQQMIHSGLSLISREASRELCRISGANPGFLTELIGQIGRHHGSSDLITLGDIHNLQNSGLIPDRIENLLLCGFETLDLEMKSFLRLASIFPGSFNMDDLHLATELDPKKIQVLLTRALEADWLILADLLPQPVYRYANSLLRDSVYQSILLSEKKNVHLRMAKHLESFDQNDPENLEKTAYHYIGTQQDSAICLWAKRLAIFYDARGALELSRRNWDLLHEHSSDPTEKMEAKLSALEISLKLAENEPAHQELQALKELENQPGILRDRYYCLWAMYLNNSSRFPELRSFTETKLPLVQDALLAFRLRMQYLEMLSSQGEPELFLQQALPLYKTLDEHREADQLSALCGVLGQFHMNQGFYRKAYQFYRRKEKLAERLRDPIGRRIASSGMGNALFRQGKKPEALLLHQRALEISEKSGDRNGYSKALLNIGTFHRNQGSYEEALRHYEKSLLIARHMGNLMQESIIIYDIGELYSYQDRHEEALVNFQESLRIAERIGDESGKSFCFDAIGDNYFKRGFISEAKATYEANLELQKRINDREGIAHTYGNLGNIAKTDSNWDQARSFYRKQLEILTKVGDQDGCGRAWFNLAMIDLETDDPDSAYPKLEEALKLFTSCGAEYYIQITREQMETVAHTAKLGEY